MKRHVKQNLLILLFSVLTLGFLVLTVLELLPGNDRDFTFTEPVSVASAPINAAKDRYSSVLTGILNNKTDSPVTVEEMTVRVTDGKTAQEITLGGFTVPARAEYELLKQWEGDTDADRVLSVSVRTGDGERSLENRTDVISFGTGTLVLLLLTLLSGAFLYHAALVRRYLWEEDKFLAGTASPDADAPKTSD